MRYVTEWDIPSTFQVGDLRSLMENIRGGAEASMQYRDEVPESIKIVWTTTGAPIKPDEVLKRAMGTVEGLTDAFSEFDVAEHIQELNACFDIHIRRPEQEGVGLPVGPKPVA